MPDRTENRQAIWDAILAQGEAWFHTSTINRACPAIGRSAIGTYLRALHAAGRLERRKPTESDLNYRLVGDRPKAAPRVRDDGSPVVHDKGRENMWRTLRKLRETTPRDLAAHCTTDAVEVSETAAAAYCRQLHRAGYLRHVGGRGAVATFRLIRNTGAHAPRKQTVVRIVDPNTGDVHDLEGGS